MMTEEPGYYKLSIGELLRSREYFINAREDYIERWSLSFTEDELAAFRGMVRAARESKIIFFDAAQVKVFWDLIVRARFAPDISYRLPFPSVWLQYSSEINITDGIDPFGPDNVALLLTQEGAEGDTMNTVVSVSSGADDEYVTWRDSDPQAPHVKTFDDHPESLSHTAMYRLLAAACIQYINCENIYLESVGGAPESVNRKREAKGKRRLEPYYVCRIRGVSYDKNDASGTGSKHGIRYDVRGHFRRLTTGKTIWVRAHQRGITNELYVPKVYKVDRRPQL